VDKILDQTGSKGTGVDKLMPCAQVRRLQECRCGLISLACGRTCCVEDPSSAVLFPSASPVPDKSTRCAPASPGKGGD